MNYKRANYIVGLCVFLISTVVYLLTIHPSISFWDSGELAACSVSLSIPHAPGAPLWIILSKFATFLPIGSDPALRINILSSVFSGISVFFLYLIIVELIISWNGAISNRADSFLTFGAAIIGSLSFAFCDSFWSVAHVSDVYGFGMMLTLGTIYLFLRFWNHPEPMENSRFIYIAGFVIGLSLSSFPMVAQVIPFMILLFYFKNFGFSRKTFFAALIISILFFAVVTPVISSWYPSWLSGSIKSLNVQNSFIVVWLSVLLIPLILVGTFFAFKNKKKYLVLAFTFLIFVIAGYTEYYSVNIRSKADNLLINESKPQSFGLLSTYIKGDNDNPHIWPRRFSKDSDNNVMWTRYSTDMSFAWNYQLNHEFTRYFGWQYIGRGGIEKNSGIDWNKLYGIPLIIGLFGIFYHFKKSWKSAFAFLWLFLIMGIFTAIYLNLQEPQPHERDYYFLGAFSIYSLWIGIGVFGLAEIIKEKIKSAGAKRFLSYSIIFLLFIFIPVNSFRINYRSQNQSNNHVPFDYAYNNLQSVESNGILFTNGDNDSYPLWYLQTLGYRTDVSVININLLNEDWYIKQIKNYPPNGSLKVPLNMTDEQLMSLKPVQWGDFKIVSMNLPADSSNDETNSKMSWKVPATITVGENKKCIRKCDLMIIEILKSNNWKRPVYFSTFVNETNLLGLGEYLVSEGMAKKLVPDKDESGTQFRVDNKLYDNLMNSRSNYSKSLQSGFFFTRLNEMPVSLDDISLTVVQGYRSQYLALAYSYLSTDTQKVAAVLDKMEQNIPYKVIPMNYQTQHDVAMLYLQTGNKLKFNELSGFVEKKAKEELAKNPNDIQSPWNPYKLLLDIYDGRGDYENEIDILNRLHKITPDSREVNDKIESVRAKMEGKNNNP